MHRKSFLVLAKGSSCSSTDQNGEINWQYLYRNWEKGRTYISWIRNNTARFIWLDGAKWVIFCRGALLRHEVEQRTLAHIWKANTAHLEIGLDAPKGDDIVRRRFHCLLYHTGV